MSVGTAVIRMSLLLLFAVALNNHVWAAQNQPPSCNQQLGAVGGKVQATAIRLPGFTNQVLVRVIIKEGDPHDRATWDWALILIPTRNFPAENHATVGSAEIQLKETDLQTITDPFLIAELEDWIIGPNTKIYSYIGSETVKFSGQRPATLH